MIALLKIKNTLYMSGGILEEQYTFMFRKDNPLLIRKRQMSLKDFLTNLNADKLNLPKLYKMHGHATKHLPNPDVINGIRKPSTNITSPLSKHTFLGYEDKSKTEIYVTGHITSSKTLPVMNNNTLTVKQNKYLSTRNWDNKIKPIYFVNYKEPLKIPTIPEIVVNGKATGHIYKKNPWLFKNHLSQSTKPTVIKRELENPAQKDQIALNNRTKQLQDHRQNKHNFSHRSRNNLKLHYHKCIHKHQTIKFKRNLNNNNRHENDF